MSVYFNPLPRKEGDCPLPEKSMSFAISIHSLVKRETLLSVSSMLVCAISIHSLVKRETYMVSG